MKIRRIVLLSVLCAVLTAAASIASGGGRGFGPYMQPQIALVGSTDKTFLLEPGFGHIDHFMTQRHRDFVEKPIFEWASHLFGHH